MKNVKAYFFMALLLFFLFEDAVLLYNRFHPDQAIVGLKLSSINVSTLSKSQIALAIQRKIDTETPLILQSAGRVFEVRKKDIGARIDYQQTLSQLIDEGRKGNAAQNILDQNKALIGLDDKKVVGQVSRPLLSLKVLDIAQQINQEPQPPRPNFTGDWTKTISARNGLKVNVQKLSQLIVDSIFAPHNEPSVIPTQTLTKKYDSSQLKKIRKQAMEYISSPISITSGGVVFTLSINDLKSLLTVKEKADSQNPKKSILSLELDDKKLNQKLDPFAVKVEFVTNAEFDDHDARIAIYAQFYTNTRRLTEIPTGLKRSSQVLGASTTNGQRTIYLTIDDGPNIIYHPLVLDILRDKGIKATFYLVGSNSKLYAKTTERTIREGHVIGDHSLTHPFLPKLAPNQILDEIKSTQDILNSFLQGSKIRLFRPPYGGTNAYVAQDAGDLGLKTEFWTVDPRDWAEPSTEELVNRVVNNVQDNAVILLHSNHFSTVKALPIIIDKLKQQGYQFKLQQ